MAKSTKLTRSNRAHLGLAKFHKKRSNGENSHFVKMNYHSAVVFQQKQKNRLLSVDEKRSTYSSVIKTFY